MSEPTIIDFRTYPEKSIYEKSSGSNKVTTLQNMKIVPNPTRGIFDVRFETTEESNVTLRIFDLTGKTIAYEEFTTSTGINTKQFNLEGISKGIYFVDMINNGIKTTSKVVIAE
ncbi:MAG: T9SS type A sorting domain-containing protein [Bacteroidetes bacterium]|nr:T9SS type A sorting domain-containing protein [Bacteroidota bacterium]